MKYLLALVLIPIATLFASSNKPIDKEKCSCEGIPLYGNVKVVTCAPTFNVMPYTITLWSDIDYDFLVED